MKENQYLTAICSFEFFGPARANLLLSYFKSAERVWKAPEKKLLEVLETEPLHLDELVRITRLPTGEISATLTIKEMKGMVRSLGGGIYKKL